MEWLLATRLGRGLIALGGFLAAIATALAVGWFKGRKSQADKDEAKAAKVEAAAAESARKTYTEANEAAAAVREQAQAQPPPDTVKRDDFEGTF